MLKLIWFIIRPTLPVIIWTISLLVYGVKFLLRLIFLFEILYYKEYFSGYLNFAKFTEDKTPIDTLKRYYKYDFFEFE